jgi:hypothetical protein
MNEIVVIADDPLWNSAIGDSVLYYFGGAYPITPRPEPIFDIRQFTAAEVLTQTLKRELRTYLILSDLSDENSQTTALVKGDLGEQGIARTKTDPEFHTSIGRDKWASGQILIYVFANSIDELGKAITENYDVISARVNEHDLRQLEQLTYPQGENKGLTGRIFERFGTMVKIPIGYQLAQDVASEDGLMWFRRDTKDATVNLVLRKYPYTSEEQLTKEYIRDQLNVFGRKYVSSAEANSFLQVNDIDLPILEFNRNVSGRYAKEFRGIWEMENDFMGGPFMSYAIVNPDKAELFVIDGFIYAPGITKRDEMQQIDLIAKNLNW